MKTPTWQPQLLTTLDGVDFTLHFENEDMNPRTHFIQDCGMSQNDYDEIKAYYWFLARIEANKGGKVLAVSYLGGNCYKSLKEVMGGGELGNILDGYAPQLIEECQEEAEVTLQLLIERTEETLTLLRLKA